LTYGDDRTYEVERLVSDLDSVATVFLRMSSHFCRRRTEIGAWDRFVDDIREHSQLGLGVDVLRVSN
jgi:hypothetical protein